MFHLIEQRKWKKIRRLLRSSKGFDLCQERDESGLNCLGFALGHAAPIEVIQDMISIDASLAKATDMFGASNLHVACLNGASHEAVKFILNLYGDLASEMDNDHRAPLHHAVEYACQSGDERYSYEDVILLLCKAAPEMVHCSDNEGDTPIDLVQLVKVEITQKSREYARLHRIYSLLRDTSVAVYTENKRRWELEGCVQNLHLTDIPPTTLANSVGDKQSDSIPTASVTSGHGTGTGTTGTSDSFNSFERKKGFKRSLRDR